MAKILLIVAILVSLGTAGIGYVNRTTLKETTAELDSTKSSLAKAQGDLQKAKTDTDTVRQDVATVTAAREKAEADLTAARAEVSKANADLAAAKTAADEAKAQVDGLNAQLAEKDKTIADLSAATASAPVAAAPADDTKVQELETLVTSLEGKLRDTEARFAELNKKEQDRAAQKMREGLEGRVLAVNPAWNFVVLSIGDRQGVVNNAELLLKRGNQFLGKVRVTSVEPSTSIADIVANSLPSGVSVQPGDSVIFRSSAN
jgi:uncharacterized protein (DUF3084 family)